MEDNQSPNNVVNDSATISTTALKRVLGRGDLMGIAVGQIIGAGVMALTGIAIGMTGRSVVFAFLLSAIFTIIISIPYIFLGSTLRLRGGMYTQAALFINKRFSGFYIIIYIISNIAIALYALSFADYLLALIPAINKSLIAFLILTLFYVTNIFGIQGAAKIQNAMVIILALALAVFSIYGLFEIKPGYFNSTGFMTGGWTGFFTATALLSFATGGAQVVVNFGAEAKNPKKDVPFTIIVSTLAVGVIYGFMAIVAAGVLPLDQVINQPLSIVAENILPKPIFVFFIVGGAMFALTTTLNATLGWVTKPVLQACVDGWFPKKLGALNKHNSPHWLLTIFYIIGVIPIFTGLDIGTLANLALLLNFAVGIIVTLGTIRMPKLFPNEWAKSPFKVSNGAYIIYMILAVACYGFQFYYLAKSQPTWLIWGNLGILVIAILYAYFRDKSGKVKMEVSHETT
jgi:APA family basic amino acid/polyamine antiporter